MKPREAVKEFIDILRISAAGFSADHAVRLSAALAYYMVLSIAPLLVIAISIAGWTSGMGGNAASAVQGMVSSAEQSGKGLSMAVVGFAILLTSVSAILAQLKDAMNTVWRVEPKHGGSVSGFVRSWFLPLLMVLMVGLPLLFSPVLAAAVFTTGAIFPMLPPIGQGAGFLVGLVIAPLVFATIFKVLPDTHVQWREVWPGSLLTGVLFMIGSTGVTACIGKQDVFSPYGAAGAVILVLTWIYYSANILLFGAEFTHVYARGRGRPSRPVPLRGRNVRRRRGPSASSNRKKPLAGPGPRNRMVS